MVDLAQGIVTVSPVTGVGVNELNVHVIDEQREVTDVPSANPGNDRSHGLNLSDTAITAYSYVNGQYVQGAFRTITEQNGSDAVVDAIKHAIAVANGNGRVTRGEEQGLERLVNITTEVMQDGSFSADDLGRIEAQVQRFDAAFRINRTAR